MARLKAVKESSPYARKWSAECRVIPWQEAKFILEKWNTRNFRSLSNSHARNLGKKVNRGEFSATSDGIAFDTEGYLCNGQHRLTASVVRQTDIPVVIVYGMTEEGIKATDIDRKSRTVADILASMGYPDPRMLSASLRWLWRYDRGPLNLRYRAPAPTPIELYSDTLSEWPEVHEARSRTRSHMTEGIIRRRGMFTAFRAVISRVDEDKANYFCSHLDSGESLKKADPIWSLRQKMQMTHELVATDSRLGPVLHERLAWWIKGWNAFYEGRKCRKIDFPVGESYPRVSGCQIGATWKEEDR